MKKIKVNSIEDNKPNNNWNSAKGFSMIELMVVMVIVGIMSAIAIYGIANSRIEQTDAQAAEILNNLQEARMRALTHRKTVRVVINDTKKYLYLVDEIDPLTADDDVIVKRIPFNKNVSVGVSPSNIVALPVASFPSPVLSHTKTNYIKFKNDYAITLRFLSDGRVVNEGSNDIGAGAIVRGATIYVHNRTQNGNLPNLIRALMVSGNSGTAYINRCNLNAQHECVAWKR